MFRNLFEKPGTDVILLKIVYGLSAVITLITNIAVLRSLLLQRKKTRTTKLFLVLSTSDIIVGAVTMPLTMLLFYTYIAKDTYCKLIPVIIYFIYAPVNFSWTTTIVIALDRCLMITQNQIHYKYLTDKVICIIVVVNFCIANSLASWHLFTVKYTAKILDANPFNITLSVLEICFVCLTAILYIYLLWYVRKKSKIMASNQITDGRKNYSSKTTTTTAYVFLCLVACNVNQLFGMIYITWSKTTNIIVVRNTIFWTLLPLYLNSFLNAVILKLRGVTSAKNGRSISLASLASRHSVNDVKIYALQEKKILIL